MNRKIVAAIGLSTILMTASMGVNAQITADDASSAVTVSGTVSSAKEGVNIGIDVFCPDMDYSDTLTVPPAEFARVFAYRGQVVSSENGEWSLSFKIVDNPEWDYDAKSGEYTAVISPADNTRSYTEKFTFVNLAEAEAAINSLKTAGDAEILQLLEDGKYALGINYDFYASLDKNKIKDILKTEIANGALTNVTTAEGISVVRKAVLIEGLNEGRVVNLFDYEDVLKLNEAEIVSFINKDYVILNEQSISAGLNGKAMASFADFNASLTEATILAVVKNPDGEANIKEIADAFDTKIGYTAPLSDAAYRAVMGQSYTTLSALGTALTTANQSGTTPGNKPGGTGGSGGGGGGGSYSGTIAPVVITPVQSETAPMAPDIFTDIENVSWAKDAIIYLAQKGIVNGKTENTFCPDDSITREEAAKILVLSFAPDAQEAEINFNDVDKGEWYYSYVAKAVSAGIVTGYSDTQFGVGDNVSRQDVVTMIYRAAVNSGIVLETEQISFADVEEIADYAKEAVGALNKAEIVSGVDFQTFAPHAQATRAQMAKIIYRLLEL